MKLSKKIALLATALLSLAFISCKTDSSETGGSSNPNPTLPGTKGGKDNEKDIFAGKIFYDSSEKDQAEYNYTKYTFSENGTVAITYTKKDDEKSYEQAIINYSLSEDGKIVYMTYNKIRNPMGSNDKLYTYTEFEQYLYNDAAKETLDNLNNNPHSSEEVKKVTKDYIAKECGLAAYTTDEELLAAMQKYSKEHAEDILTPIKKTFTTVFQYDLSKDEVDSHPVITEKNTWGKDLSKFISLSGSSYYYYSSADYYFRFSYSYGDFDGRYDDEKNSINYYVEKVDSSKIYFESSEDEKGNTTKLEASYTISDDGYKLTLTIDGKPIEAILDLDRINLYQ